MTAKPTKLTDREIDALERMVPVLAKLATKAAYYRALSASNSVLIIDSGDLVRVSPDGSKTFVAKGKPRRKVAVGETITVRRLEGKKTKGDITRD
ncbi:hypothetical protein AABC73_00985 [Pseudomonas sp. G.S.17]|uniref:hypothetical protein n=1 Tax=Pseudomonas sp. G.S.17 TaxID=3137451 RepID=UPI00311CAC83